MINTLVIIQARSDSKRLPNKVLKRIGKYNVIEMLIKRIKKSKFIDVIIVVTSKDISDD